MFTCKSVVTTKWFSIHPQWPLLFPCTLQMPPLVKESPGFSSCVWKRSQNHSNTEGSPYIWICKDSNNCGVQTQDYLYNSQISSLKQCISFTWYSIKITLLRWNILFFSRHIWVCSISKESFSVECTYLDRSRSYENRKADSWIKVTLVIPVNKLGQIILQTYVQAGPK